ncbi:hypothetical protein [Photobacterium sp. OFAV2-7]|uniref:hypothetical protein n=1 Tax=Photobacterium sp. OFAV2-7 TaxID=2917748 RepID=UPI001EF4A026|nr:hypothetical protein [Photobacterium sp. OFAV2-7]MCG7585394.1 hypothetical protein [Photobacterium sp. OFAV2-7]
MKKALVATLGIILTGCGSESSPSISGLTESTRLSDNNAPPNARFEQYRISAFELDPSQFALAGNRVFLKVYSSSGNVLFLGQINKQKPVSLPLSLPNSERVVKFDLFSDLDGDNSISRERQL